MLCGYPGPAIGRHGMSGVYTLFTDETNVSPKHDFLIYGGLAMSDAAMVAAHALVAEIRAKYGFQPGDQLKFQTASRPEMMDYETWTSAKTELIARASEIDELDLIIYVILHAIAKGKLDQERVEYALNALVAHFDMRYLVEKQAYGVVTVDRLDAKFGFKYLRKRFGEPLDLPNGRSEPLTRIILLSQTCDGASHLSSLVDVVLGGFRYCVNTAGGNGKDDVAQKLFPPLAKMMWGQKQGNVRRVGGYGFLKYPKLVKAARFQVQYDALAASLEEYSISTVEDDEEVS